jgi:GNAT superfamily N-acetyltransferase
MQIINTKILTPQQEEQINKLWNEEYPIRLADRFKLLLEGVQNYNHYILEDEHQNLKAWAVDFVKDNEIRFSIIVRSEQKGKGLGSSLVEKLKLKNKEFYGWVIDHDNDFKSNGENYKTPMPFYLKHGFSILKDCRIETEIISAVKIKWTTKIE